MSRFLPLALIPLMAVSAWRRETGVPMREPRVTQTIVECRAAAPEAPAKVVIGPSSPHVLAGRGKRERQLEQQVALLETQLRETTDKLDEYRAALARHLNHRGPDPVQFLTYALSSSQERVMELEAQLEILETAYVERVAWLRRSD